MTEQSSVNDGEQRALDNIPEFSDCAGATEYDHMKAHYDRMKANEHAREHARHGAAMFATGVIEGLRQAIYAIENDRKEIQPSRNWPGMNCAIAAIKRAIDRQTCKNSNEK